MKGFICCLLVSVALLSACAPISAPLPEAETAPVGTVPLGDALPTLEPQDVWRNFYALTQIPRPSGHLKQVRAYLVQFGQDLGLETSVDDAGNVLIRKPAAPGMEDRKGVILQAHMDMVPQKTPEKIHDFTADPIQAYVDGEWVRAAGTTLGADDGIGVAIAMAALQSQTLVAGPIEALFTVDEETTMSGAEGLKPGVLQGDLYINLDAEEEGAFIIGSAGGALAGVTAAYAEVAAPSGMAAYAVSVQGLKGGHSGVDIDRGRGNAVKLLVRFLSAAGPAHGVRIAVIEGGNAANAIPREATALVCLPTSQANAFLEAVEQYQATIQSELAAVEPELSVQAAPADPPANVMDESAQRVLIAALYATPHGVMRMSDAVPGLVETSTNLGIVDGRDGRLSLTCNMRSSVDSALDDLAAMVSSVWELAGAETVISGRYSGWAPNAESPLLALMQQVYAEMNGQPPQVSAVHAGLECGTIVAKYPGMEAISIGPTLHDVHTPDEELHIASVQKLVDFLFEVLSRVPAK